MGEKVGRSVDVRSSEGTKYIGLVGHSISY